MPSCRHEAELLLTVSMRQLRYRGLRFLWSCFQSHRENAAQVGRVQSGITYLHWQDSQFGLSMEQKSVDMTISAMSPFCSIAALTSGAFAALVVLWLRR